MKSFAVIFAIFVMAVFAADKPPEFPYSELCSMQGSGSLRYHYSGEKYAPGNFDMKRVNGTAIFNFEFTIKTRDAENLYLIRPDVPDAYLYVKDGQGSVPSYSSNTGFAPVFSEYEYVGVSECGEDSSSKCHWFGYEVKQLSARIAFKEDDMSLVSEYFSFAEKDFFVEFYYDGVKEYQHDKLDDVFSSSHFGKSSPANSYAPWALSSACREDPALPYDEICSVQGSGSFTYVYDLTAGKSASGNFEMKRVNGTAIFDLDFTIKARDTGDVFLIRPDANDAYLHVNENQAGVPAATESIGFACDLSQYIYLGILDCGQSNDFKCHWFGYSDTQSNASIAFKEDDMSLVSESFTFRGEKARRMLTMYYSSLKSYEHYKIDSVFTCNAFPRSSPACSLAPWASSSACSNPSSDSSSSSPSSESSSEPSSDPSSITPSSVTPSSVTPSSVTPSSVTPSSTTPSSTPSSTASSGSESRPSSAAVHLPSFLALALLAVAFIVL